VEKLIPIVFFDSSSASDARIEDIFQPVIAQYGGIDKTQGGSFIIK